MRRIKLILSLILVLSAITSVIISANGFDLLGRSISYQYYDDVHHKVITDDDWYLEPHTLEPLVYYGIGWDEYNNKFHEFAQHCSVCQFDIYYRAYCTGTDCWICARYEN